jgi:hypothetical protein
MCPLQRLAENNLENKIFFLPTDPNKYFREAEVPGKLLIERPCNMLDVPLLNDFI